MPLATLEAFAKKFLRGWCATYPVRASNLGLHGYDGAVTDYSPQGIEKRVAELGLAREELAHLHLPALASQAWLDYELLRLVIERELFEWETLREWARNPMTYLNGCDVSLYLKRAYAPLPDRARAIAEHLEHIPDLLALGRANLELPLPRTFVQVSLEIAQGLMGFLQNDLPPGVQDLADAALASRIAAAQERALAAMGAFERWLREQVLPQAGADYAIGVDAFQQMLAWGEGVDLPLEKLWAVAQDDLARNKAEFEAICRQMAPARSPAAVAAEMRRHHPTAASLIPETAGLLDKLRAFVAERGLVSIPDESQPTVTATPSFLRWAFAMMDTPGPFEKTDVKAYYYITPPEHDWPETQANDWLSEFNYYSLEDTSIHEVWPGHYLHWLHSRNAPSQVTRTLDSYAFVEGWALYAEEMMVEAGYGEGEPYLKLAQLEGALLRDVRFLCSIGLHTQGMTVDDATRRFQQDAHLVEMAARKEAERGTFDPGYLAYTLGKLMLVKLRRDCEREQGASFDLKQFHDTLLSFGAPPVPLVRKMMLQSDDGQIL